MSGKKDGQSRPIIENEHVKELFDILRENQISAKDLTVMLGSVAAMESQLDRAMGELTAMRQELASLREERGHPVRAALSGSVASLETHVAETRSKLERLKDAVVSGCRNAVAAFKRTGLSALDNVARFFHLKPVLQELSGSLDSLIKANDRSIARIEAVSAEYHTAGRHIKNFGRVLAGKEPIQEIKPNGKLAGLLEAPFKLIRNLRTDVKRDVDRVAAALDRLEKGAAALDAKPSVLEGIRQAKQEKAAEQAGREAPKRDRAPQKRQEADL
jgi:ElaB/YqjD/DUF883 family membrane-anchored ribosome-binding protein